MASYGYTISTNGNFYLHVKFTPQRYFISRMYKSLDELQKALPEIITKAKSATNLSRFKHKDTNRLHIVDKDNKTLAFTSAIPNDKIEKAFISDITSLFKALPKDFIQNIPLLHDYSKNTIKINSVTTFLDEIEKIKITKDETFYFRGHSSYLYTMLPGIYRKKELINNEDVIHKELLIRCPDDFEKLSTTFEILVKMQHYSLPTRLLDLTSNPLIALYFACENYANDKSDGEVKVLTIPRAEIKYYDSDTVTILSNLSKQPKGFLKSCIDDKASPFYIRLMDDIKKERPYFEQKIAPESINSVICVKPKLNNARIIKQDGAFLLFGISDGKHDAAKIPAAYSASTAKKRFLVDKDSKEKIIGQLERIGISAATIYPEIDKVSNYISIKYGKPEELDEEPMAASKA